MSHDYTLATGTHLSPADGRCAMEWVSFLAGEPHSDQPACASPVLRALCISLNDGLDDGPRQQLRPYLARTIGTAGDGLDRARAWLAMDWLVRVYAPAWLAAAAVDGPSRQLTELAPIHDDRSLRAAHEPLRAARRAARVARRRAYAGAGPAGWIAAARDARAGRGVTWTCAGAAAWSATRLGIGEQAGHHVPEAAGVIRALAGDAAAIATHRVGSDDVCGTPTPRQAAAIALAPTAKALADSAIDLLDRMLPGVAIDALGETAEPALLVAAPARA